MISFYHFFLYAGFCLVLFCLFCVYCFFVLYLGRVLSVVGSMLAQRVQGLCSLTRRHAVKVASGVNIEDCCLAVGEVVGHSGVLSASRMNNALVVFLDSVEKANELVERGIVISGEFVSVLPLSLPAKRVTLSNVPPFVSDEILTQALSRYGKLVSPIKKIPISSESPLLKHIVSFRRFAYMIIPDDADLDLTLNFRIEDFSYTIFVTTGKTKCFGCGKTGHLIRNCPTKSNVVEKGNENRNVEQNGEGNGEVEADVTVPVGGSVVTESFENPPGELEAELAPSRREQTESTLNDASVATVSSESMSLATLAGNKKESRPITNEQIETSVSETCEVQLTSEQEQLLFKIPQKRKMKNKSLDAKICKTDDLKDTQDTESDSDSSECSASFSQSESVDRRYELEDIKLFLRSTKNKRGVRVQDYFPDMKQFADKAKSLMDGDCFTNKEVYRLKKIVRNTNNALNNDAI